VAEFADLLAKSVPRCSGRRIEALTSDQAQLQAALAL
jgi:hypothetical protein